MDFLRDRPHYIHMESWGFFISQFCPAPLPSWWRYSEKVEINEHIIDEFPLPTPDSVSDLGIHLRARDTNFELKNLTKIMQLPRFDRYLEEKILRSLRYRRPPSFRRAEYQTIATETSPSLDAINPRIIPFPSPLQNRHFQQTRKHTYPLAQAATHKSLNEECGKAK